MCHPGVLKAPEGAAAEHEKIRRARETLPKSSALVWEYLQSEWKVRARQNDAQAKQVRQAEHHARSGFFAFAAR
jgi:hypothetical protein